MKISNRKHRLTHKKKKKKMQQINFFFAALQCMVAMVTPMHISQKLFFQKEAKNVIKVQRIVTVIT